MITHGMRKHPMYNTWVSMRQRCSDPKYHRWDRYGGRGIKVCERWLEFENFLEDMGVRPKGTCIDRIDNDGDYEPGNCRWATRAEQCNNRRSNRWHTVNGATKNTTQWARDSGLSVHAVRMRINNGETMSQALDYLTRKKERLAS